MAQHVRSNHSACGATREEAIEVFKRDWNDRSDIRIIDGAPPRPPRPGFAGDAAEIGKPAEPAAKVEDRLGQFVARVVKRFHSDIVGADVRFSGDDVVRVLLEERDRGET
jgi:broad specificity phosphatase PhoE